MVARRVPATASSAGPRSKNQKLLIAIGVAALVFLGVFAFIEFGFSDAAKGEIYFWIQMFSGTSWAEWQTRDVGNGRFAFIVAATIHTLITAGPFLGVVWILYRLLSTRTLIMTIAQVLENRDRNIIFAIQTLLGKMVAAQRMSLDVKKSVSAELKGAIDTADEMWQDDLKTILGPVQAAKLLEQLKAQRLVDSDDA